MQKPTGITISTVLMCLFLVIGLVMTFTRPLPVMPSSAMSPSAMAGMVHIFAAVFTIIAAVCVWFYWSGQEWARWIVMADCVFTFFGLTHISKSWATSHLGAIVTICQVLLAIFLLYYLNTAPVRAWFSRKEPTAV
jgi:hypothetical protein